MVCVCIRVHSSPSPSAQEFFQKLRYLDFSHRASGVMDVLRDTEVTIDILYLYHLPLLLLEAVSDSSLSINQVAVGVQRFPDQVRKLIVSHLIGHSGFARDGGMLMFCVDPRLYTYEMYSFIRPLTPTDQFGVSDLSLLGSFGLFLGRIEQGPKIGVGDSFGVPCASSLESSRYSL